MPAGSERRALEIVAGAFELPSAEREAYVAQACAGNPGLRDAVDELLRADRQLPGDFLQEPALQAAARLLPVADPGPALAEGTALGGYRIVRHLGSGGMGAVYEALDLRLQRAVALKVLLPSYAGDAERIRRFEQEARAASRLNHPNIVSIFDANGDAAAGPLFIVTELVRGQTLRELIRRGPLAEKTLVELTIQMASALAAAHGAGIVHRDIKPENIMRRPDGIAKILDFGLAKLLDTAPADPAATLASRAGRIAGTAHYLSPEQVLGQPAGPRSDLFSLGVLLYEIATGVRPFEGPTDGAIFNAILHTVPAPPTRWRPDLSPALEGIIQRLLEKDPDLRIQTAEDLRAALRAIDRGSQATGSQPALAEGPPAKRRPSWGKSAWAAVAAAAAAAIATWAWMRAAAPVPAGGVPAFFARQSDEPGEDLFPSLSPDGKQLVFAGERNGNVDIFLKRTGGSATINLTANSKEVDTMPAFSHDGARIVFRSGREGGGLFVMEATGENPQRISRRGFFPSWAPGDDRVVASTRDFFTPSRRRSGSELFVVTLATGEERMLPGTNDAIQPAWSPHGHRIAYWGLVGKTNQRDLFTIPADGSAPPLQLTFDEALDWNPVWAPAGDALYFLSDRGGTMNAWRLAVDERTGAARGSPIPMTLPVVFARHLSFSANGTSFAFVRAEEHMALNSAGFDPVNLRLTGAPAPVGDSRSHVGSFSLSPDESRIAYDTLGGYQENLWIMNADGSGRRRITSGPFHHRDPAWSPDGEEIAFYSDRDGRRANAWVVRTDGSGLRPVTDLAPSEAANGVAWSHDGQRVILTVEPGGAMWVPRRGPVQRPVLLPGLGRFPWTNFELWNPPLNPAESDLWLLQAADANSTSLWLYRMSTGQMEPTGVVSRSVAWLPGQRQFVYLHDRALWLYDRANRQARLLHSLTPHEPWVVRVTRDGRRIYFSQTVRQGEIWTGRLEPPPR